MRRFDGHVGRHLVVGYPEFKGGIKDLSDIQIKLLIAGNAIMDQFDDGFLVDQCLIEAFFFQFFSDGVIVRLWQRGAGGQNGNQEVFFIDEKI
jgi:hypothetical protein